MAGFAFHPDAFLEYAETAAYYTNAASPAVAEKFATAVESAIASILQAPERWPVTHEPNIRRYVLKRFPYAIYYRWAPTENFVTIYAVMHCRRRPGYWRHRTKPDKPGSV